MQQSLSAPAHAVAWFSIPTLDFDRAVRFYEAILELPLRVGDFGPEKLAVFPRRDGGIGGAVVSGTPSASGTIVYLCADGRFDRVLARTVEAGGSVAVAKSEVPNGMGVSAQIVDSEGNRIGLHASA